MRLAEYAIGALVVCLLSLGLLTFSEVEAATEPPDELVFESKLGDVTFDHAKHVERAEKDCEVCHDKLFPQSRAPLNFKAGMHKPAEKNQTSCGACHSPEGEAFETKGNCKTCHVKK